MIERPLSTILVALTPIALSLVTSLATRALVDLEHERRVMAEYRDFTQKLRQAMSSGDKALVAKLKKREKQMRGLQAKAQWSRMKVTLALYAPLILVYFLLGNLVGGFGAIVAISPVAIPYVTGSIVVGGAAVQGMSLIWWYLVASFAFASTISKLTGTSIR